MHRRMAHSRLDRLTDGCILARRHMFEGLVILLSRKCWRTIDWATATTEPRTIAEENGGRRYLLLFAAQPPKQLVDNTTSTTAPDVATLSHWLSTIADRTLLRGCFARPAGCRPSPAAGKPVLSARKIDPYYRRKARALYVISDSYDPCSCDEE